MGDDLAAFTRNFGTMVRLAQEAQPHSSCGRELVETLTAHLDADPGGLAMVVEDVPAHRFMDADIILASLAPGGRCVGIGGGDQRHRMSLGDMIQQSGLYQIFPLSQPDYTNLARPTRSGTC